MTRRQAGSVGAWRLRLTSERQRYGVALLAWLIATGLRWVADPWLGLRLPWLTFYAAVGLTAWCCGRKPALLTSVLGLSTGVCLLWPYRLESALHNATLLVELLCYVVVSATVAVILGGAGARHRETELANGTLAEQNRRLGLLADAAGKLLSTEDANAAVTAFYQGIADGVGADVFFEFELVGNGQALELTSCWAGGEAQEKGARCRLRLGEGIAGQVAEHRQAVVRSGVQESTQADEALIRSYGVKAYACYPMVAGSRLMGTLSFASREREEFSEADQQFFTTLANYVALAKERRRLLLEAERYAAGLEMAVRERTAKLQDMVVELRQMSYSMVHEMRAPLRSITGFIHFLRRSAGDRLDAEELDYLDRIQRSAGRMDLLVSEALNFNKILLEDLPMETVDVESVLRETVRTISEFQPPQAEVRLLGPFPKVIGNRGLLARCFSHLLRNAVHYVSPGKRPVIEIFAQPVEGRVRLCFSDNGVGIAAEYQERIFQLFERGAQGASEATGVGLAFVRKMSERMQGRVWVESMPGEGSRFWLEFKAAA